MSFVLTLGVESCHFRIKTEISAISIKNLFVFLEKYVFHQSAYYSAHDDDKSMIDSLFD